MQRAIAIAAVIASAAPAAGQGPTLAELLEKATRYAVAYEREFSQSLSDEHAEQREDVVRGRGYRARTTHTERIIEAETLFAWFVNERTWLTIRNVLSVDGRMVPDSRGRLNEILDSVLENGSSGGALISRLRDESVRYNLGRIRRSFNDPMLPMKFLDPSNQERYAFTQEGADIVDGVSVWKIGFVETATPTAIILDGLPAPSSGTVWVTQSGIVVQTRIDLGGTTGSLSAAITVSYAPNAHIGAWVPARMDERYSQLATEANRDGASTTITCVTTFSNYRRRPKAEPPGRER